MKVIDQLVLACTLLGATIEAAPPVSNPAGKGFSVKAKLQPVADNYRHQKRSVHAMNKIKRRYMTGKEKDKAASMPKNWVRAKATKSKKANRKNGQTPLGGGSTVANSQSDDLEYVCEIDVGGQKMRLNFDTGSSDLWLYSSLQPKEQQKGHQVYNPKNSKTGGVPLQGGTWNISYGDGSSAGGDVHKDKVTVGGVSFDKQAFGLAKSVSESFFQDNTNDGLLGLGFTTGPAAGSGNTISINGKPSPQNTFFTNIRSTLPAPLFTVDLKHKAAGSYDFGYIDKTKYTGDLVYFPVNSTQAYWAVTSESYGIKGGKQITKTISTIIDTGTTLMLMPQSVLDDYYKNVPSAKVDNEAGGYTYPCGTKLPDFNIGFDQKGQKFTATIPSKYMDFGPATAGSNTCFGSMQVMSKSDSLDAIYGDIFLKAVFTVFEAKTDSTARIGFAMKPEAVSGSTSSPSTSPNTCNAVNQDNKPLSWILTIFNNIKNAFTGKKDTCTPSSTPDTSDPDTTTGDDGGDDAGDDAGDDSGDDAGDDSFGDDDDDAKNAAKKNKKQKQVNKKKAKEVAKKKVALKKAIKKAQASLAAREEYAYEFEY